DAFALMDISGERCGIIITRGASNGPLVSALIPENSTAYLWTQNDAAAEKWEKDICARAKAAVERVKIPVPHKDLNDWTRAGATGADLLDAMVRGDVVPHAATTASVETEEANAQSPNESTEPGLFPLDALNPTMHAMAEQS